MSSCREDHWTSDEIECFLHANPAAVGKTCEPRLTPAQRGSFEQRFDDALAAARRELDAKATGGETLDQWIDLAPDTGVLECDDYFRAWDAFMRCDSIPPTLRVMLGRQMRDLLTHTKPYKDPRFSRDEGMHDLRIRPRGTAARACSSRSSASPRCRRSIR